MRYVRWSLGVLLTVVFLVLGFSLLDLAPQVGALMLAFGVLRGALVARHIWLETRGGDEL